MQNLLLVLAPLLAQDTWTPLSLPEPCRSAPGGTSPGVAEGGGHLLLEEPGDSGRARPGGALQPEALVGLLEIAATAAGHRPEFFPYAPPLQVRGSDAALAWTRQAVASVDAAGRRNRVRLSAWLVPGAEAERPTGELPAGARAWTAEARAGEPRSFGERTRQSFVASYEIEVSTDSGVARPVVGQALLGEVLELTASRVAGGASYHLRGRLDLAELAGLETFDAGTPDLGALTQPALNALTLDFSGVAASGEALEVRLAGTPLETPDWSLFVVVETRPEPRGPAAEGAPLGADWRAIDVSLLETRPPVLAALDPGAGLAADARLSTATSESAAITAAGVLGLVRADGSRPGSPRGATPAQVADGLVLAAAVATPESLAERLAGLVRSLEAPRLATRQVEVRHGELRVSFPVAAGEVSRLVVGQERSLLTGYRTEIAPNTWMPVPVVEVAIDGLALQARLGGGHLEVEAWSSETLGITRQERRDAKVGALQLPERRVRSTRARIEGPLESLLDAESTRPGLAVGVEQR